MIQHKDQRSNIYDDQYLEFAHVLHAADGHIWMIYGAGPWLQEANNLISPSHFANVICSLYFSILRFRLKSHIWSNMLTNTSLFMAFHKNARPGNLNARWNQHASKCPMELIPYASKNVRLTAEKYTTRRRSGVTDKRDVQKIYNNPQSFCGLCFRAHCCTCIQF